MDLSEISGSPVRAFRGRCGDPLCDRTSSLGGAGGNRASVRRYQKPQTGLTSPTCRPPPGQNSGHPPDSSRADLLHPGFDVTLLSYDTSTAIPENEGLRTVFPVPT